MIRSLSIEFQTRRICSLEFAFIVIKSIFRNTIRVFLIKYFIRHIKINRVENQLRIINLAFKAFPRSGINP